MSRHPRMHEWAWRDEGRRTVCGLEAKLPGSHVPDVTVHDLGAVDVADRCRNCERMRAAIGTSSKRSKREAVAP